MTGMLSALIALQAIALPADTTSVITAAITRAQTDYAVEVRGASFEVARRVPGSARVEGIRPSVASVLASRFGMTATAENEAVKCDAFVPGQDVRSRKCQLTRSNVFVGVLVRSVSQDSAVVSIEVVTPHGHGIFSRSATYELVRNREGWAVTKVISQGAS